MCGLAVEIGSPSCQTNALVDSLNKNRGPDAYSCKSFNPLNSTLQITMHGWVLHLRGDKAIQPAIIDGNYLLFNGEIFGGEIYDKLGTGNDTEFLSKLLNEQQTQDGILKIIASIHGPFAFVYWKKSLQRLYYGRDFLGRRSLVKLASKDSIFLSSVANDFLGNDGWEEVSTTGIYYLDQSLDIKSIHIPWSDSDKMGIPRLNSRLSIDDYTPKSNLNDFIITDEIHQTIRSLYNVLYSSLKSRISCIQTIQKNLENQTRPRLAILFSGGLDCSIIAAMAHSILNRNEPIDLLNVAFENPRKSNSSFDVPDRITGRSSHQELTVKFPDRIWNFIEINVSFKKYIDAKPRVLRLMNPCSSVMDLSIAMALWFASSGSGFLNSTPYTTSAKVLLSGLGADELFGGYSRHASSFSNHGWEGLLREIQLDMDRISTRNLGRDDRIISDHGKEVRFPFLDEILLKTVSEIPINLKMDLRYPKGMGDKLLLRLLCHHELKWPGDLGEMSFPPGFEPLAAPETEDYSRIDDWTRDLLNETNELTNDQDDQVNLIDFYSPVQMLSNLFPQMSSDDVEKLLSTHGYDLEAALNQMYQQESVQKKQVCRHFLSGGCYRKDCWFSHDLDAKVCKYWLMGSCNRGDSCQFMHGDQVYDKLNSVSNDKVPTVKNEKIPSDLVFNSLEFPTLGQTSDSSLFNFNTPNYGELMKRTDKKDVKLETVTPTTHLKSSQTIVDIPWVSTGDTLATSYFKHRESAIQVALERNKLFQRATECYLSGNKAAAKAYSSQAQSLNSQLQNLHACAAVKLFSERNPDWKTNGIIDLHGLHPQEISSILSLVFSQSPNSNLTLITGTGNHSRKSYSSLCPSVENYLNSRGVTWSIGSMSDKRRGVYLVRL